MRALTDGFQHNFVFQRGFDGTHRFALDFRSNLNLMHAHLFRSALHLAIHAQLGFINVHFYFAGMLLFIFAHNGHVIGHHFCFFQQADDLRISIRRHSARIVQASDLFRFTLDVTAGRNAAFHRGTIRNMFASGPTRNTINDLARTIVQTNRTVRVFFQVNSTMLRIRLGTRCILIQHRRRAEDNRFARNFRIRQFSFISGHQFPIRAQLGRVTRFAGTYCRTTFNFFGNVRAANHPSGSGHYHYSNGSAATGLQTQTLQ